MKSEKIKKYFTYVLLLSLFFGSDFLANGPFAGAVVFVPEDSILKETKREGFPKIQVVSQPQDYLPKVVVGNIPHFDNCSGKLFDGSGQNDVVAGFLVPDPINLFSYCLTFSPNIFEDKPELSYSLSVTESAYGFVQASRIVVGTQDRVISLSSSKKTNEAQSQEAIVQSKSTYAAFMITETNKQSDLLLGNKIPLKQKESPENFYQTDQYEFRC